MTTLLTILIVCSAAFHLFESVMVTRCLLKGNTQSEMRWRLRSIESLVGIAAFGVLVLLFR